MRAILYTPGRQPVAISSEGLYLPDTKTGFVSVSETVAKLLDSPPELVDVLVFKPGYVAYSLFDNDGGENTLAMDILAKEFKSVFHFENEDEILRGPILILSCD